MSKESKQILFDQISAVTTAGGIKKTAVRNAFTALNDEKIENDGSNLSPSDIISLRDKLNIDSFEYGYQVVNTGSSASFSIAFGGLKTRFVINSTNDIPKALLSINFSESTTKSIEFLVFNNTNLNINIASSATTGLQKGFEAMNMPFVILPKSYALLKYNPQTDLIECWKVNSNSGSSYPTIGNNGDILEKDSTLPNGAKWSNRLTTAESNIDTINTRTSSVVDKMLHYWDATLGKWLSAGIYYLSGKIGIGTTSPAEALDVNGRAKANSLVLASDIGTAVPNELGRKSGFLCYADGSGYLRFYSASRLFKYTPTGSTFTTSQLKTALEASGISYHDAYVVIVVGSSTYTCNIDNGSTNLSAMLFIGKEGTIGSVNFTSSRSLNAGNENITVLSGNEGSMVKITHGTTHDILSIRNL